MQYSIIVATDSQCGIAKDGKIPWNWSADLKHFRETTTGHIVIMGRKTCETLKAPLKDRINIVLSHGTVWDFNAIDNTDYKSIYNNGWLFCDSIHTVDIVCETIGKNKKRFVIGGAEIYNQYLEQDKINEVIWTKLSQKYDCDKFFPSIRHIGIFNFAENKSVIGIPGYIQVWRQNG